MDALLTEEEFYLTPTAGEFQADDVAPLIAGLGKSFRDELEPDYFIVLKDAEALEYFQTRRQEFPDLGFPPALVIRVQPQRISIFQAAGKDEEYTGYVRALLTGLKGKCQFTSENQYGQDLTAVIHA